jgi:hypothetical protein
VGIGVPGIKVWLWLGIWLSVSVGVDVGGCWGVGCWDGPKVETSVDVVGVNRRGKVGICWTGRYGGGCHGGFGGGGGVGSRRSDSGWGWEGTRGWSVWNMSQLWDLRLCGWRVGGWSGNKVLKEDVLPSKFSDPQRYSRSVHVNIWFRK